MRQIIKCFALDLTASQTAKLTGISRQSINRIYTKIRLRIFVYCLQNTPFNGELEADESYFGAKRVRGKRGRGAGGKTIVFGLLKRDGCVYTEIIPDVKAKTLQAIIRGHADINSVLHTDGWPGYDGLVDVGFEKHFRVNHGNDEFSDGKGNHVNGIESFWGFAKHRLAKFKGIQIHLKETEFRFNHREQNIYKILLKWFRTEKI
ncbi:IS1595 family transposase [Stenoxybacter acetivorans]|uniref:IS1595 family transposase n=1 Tax=Stenoxybacter acetivorans TaxID=422441 RepID=UPI000A7A2477|nr:IS1595 family transposase [Stenoxybacter acetivorans]